MNEKSDLNDLTLAHLLSMVDPAVTPDAAKVHLATYNGREHPIDVYFEDRFEAWQAYQTKKNFNRRHVVSLIAMRERHLWLYAGTYDVKGHAPAKANPAHFQYTLEARSEPDALAGRLIVRFEWTKRARYLLFEKWAQSMTVEELRARRLRFSDFPGFIEFELSHPQLRAMVERAPASWRSALSCVAGVYVIVDSSNGKQYVGSAVGEGGIWDRWTSYASNGHGGNKELKELLQREGAEHASGFRYAILETADTRTTAEDVLARESHWKRALLTREHGYNAN